MWQENLKKNLKIDNLQVQRLLYATFGKYVDQESTYNTDSFIFRQNKVVAYYSVFCYNGGWYTNLNNGGDKTEMDEKRNESCPATN